MAESSVQTQLDQLLGERCQLWQQFDEAKSVGQELGTLSGQIPTCSAQSVGPFTSSKIPPEELAVALKAVRRGLERAATIASSIQVKQAEIQGLKHRDRMLVGVLLGVAVVVIAIIWSQL